MIVDVMRELAIKLQYVSAKSDTKKGVYDYKLLRSFLGTRKRREKGEQKRENLTVVFCQRLIRIDIAMLYPRRASE
jgi:hypothetical protein